MGTGTLTWPSGGSPSRLLAAVGDWLRSAAGVESRRLPALPRTHLDRQGPGTRRAAPTRPFREVATRSLGRAAFEPLPVFIPEGAMELSGWLALPRDRQALLAAIAARLDADSQRHLRTLLARGWLALRDLVGEGDLLSHLARLYTEPTGPGCDQTALLEAAIRSLAAPESVRGAVWVVWLTRNAPSELARLVAGLASARGSARLRSGRLLVRSPHWIRSPGDLLGRLLGSARLDTT